MSEPGTERSVYLAGPIEADDDPRSWRDELRERFPEVDWIDPMDWQDEWEEDPSAVWEREMETVRNNAVLVCNVGDEAPRTTGTHHEIREALNHGQPVGIVPEGTVSQVYREIEDVWIYDEVKHAVADLTSPEIVDDGLRADGGPEQADRERVCGTAGDRSHGMFLSKRWTDRAEGNVEKWGMQRHDTVLLALIEEIGEIAIALESGCGPGGGHHPAVEPNSPESRGRDLIHEMAELGRETRDLLESEYPTPAGEGDEGGEYEVAGQPNSPEDADRIFEEIDDAAPLLFQLYWAVERCSLDTGTSRSEGGEDRAE